MTKKQEWVRFECEKRVDHLGITVKGQVRVDKKGIYTWYTTHYYRYKDAGFYIPSRMTEASLEGAQWRLEGYLAEFDKAVESRPAYFF